jgi:hypothetical protein
MASLQQRYLEALRDFDAREARYVPKRQQTAVGAACLSYISNAAEHQARQNRDESQKAARALLHQQRQHPLFHTHHKDRLLSTWKSTGEPVIPPLALDHFTDWIMRHADADEDEVRKHAEAFETASIETILDRLGDFGTKFFRTESPTPRTQRNFRRTLRVSFRQFNEQAAHILKVVGKRQQKYVSDATRSGRLAQLKQQQKWIDATVATAHGRDDVPLKDCIRTAEMRFSELYTLVKGQETYFTKKGYIPLFVTLTSPSEFHPNPSVGAGAWDGSSVSDSHRWFNENWQNARASLAKDGIRLDGFRVTEPHADGAEHWHLMCYVKKEDMENARSTISEYFAHSPHAATFKADFSKNVEGKKATAASYMMKYLIKTLNSKACAGTSAANDQLFSSEADAADAWRSTWGVRSFQFFGTLFGKQTLWRELRRLDTQPAEPAAEKLWRAARGGRAALFIGTIINDDPALATLREVKEVWTDPDMDTGEVEKVGEVKGRIVGIQINKIQYITHTTKWTLETDFKALNDFLTSVVTVIHKDPRVEAKAEEKQKKHGFGRSHHPPPKLKTG